ncbi:helix-turn-helix domain-containing protein [Olsenella sp. HMSC062G07]|uniref:helix-turn-helix domain-containing protein n=1 Tax=Olsenella sp. HMSC062G07 TaxID=1739330 RepID=UPI0008A338B1|nr:helix-turn-helix domain-containing protein [Olsenella sp. HMSC062G07]OFK23302.1 hypothetical protein HMPREF2826_05155 [Olsenella sp. HMSC062G07]
MSATEAHGPQRVVTEQEKARRAATKAQRKSERDNPNAEMLTIYGAATLLNTDYQTVWRCVKTGEIQAVMIRNSWRIPRKKLCGQYGIEG